MGTVRRFLLVAVGVVAVVAMLSSSALAQRRGGQRGGFGGRGGKLGILQDPAIRAELEIVEDQEKELEKIRDEVRDKFREMFSGMRDLPAEERREAFEKMRGKMQEALKEIETKVDDILIPSQRERLGQLALQNRMRRSGTDGALADATLAKELGITEEQKKRMAAVAKKVQAELQEKINKLRLEARDEVLQVLTPQQREKLTRMIGEQYQPPARENRSPRPER